VLADVGEGGVAIGLQRVSPAARRIGNGYAVQAAVDLFLETVLKSSLIHLASKARRFALGCLQGLITKELMVGLKRSRSTTSGIRLQVSQDLTNAFLKSRIRASITFLLSCPASVCMFRQRESSMLPTVDMGPTKLSHRVLPGKTSSSAIPHE